MASEITSSPATEEPQTQTEPKRPWMPRELLQAAIDGNERNLKQLLGLNNGEQEHPLHTTVSIEPSDCLIRSAAGMENTILHILAANGHWNLASTICMEDSSLLKAPNVRNETPFHHAARAGGIKTILKLIEHAGMEFGEDGLKELLRQKNCLGETALHEAARHGHGAVVSALMEEDLELAGLVNNESVSPLYLATARRSLDMVKNMVAKMIDHEITPDFYSGPDKHTALHAAVLQDTELTKELLKLYSEPLGKGAGESRRTPLHLVASTGYSRVAKLLLNKDPSLAYIQDSDGSFPMHTAVRMGNIYIIELLLQRCPDSGQLLDGNGKNFLHIAIEANMFFVLFKLLNDPENELPMSYWMEILNDMANTMDNKGNTPLHLAAERESNDVLLYLLKTFKLDLTLQNKEGLTAPDISVIQLGKHTRSTDLSMDHMGEIYIQNRGDRFSTGWFQYYTKDQISKTEPIGGAMQNDISTTDSRGAKRSLKNVIVKAQLVGLGSVLIATVTFAAAFTLPGGADQGTGTPILGRKYSFKAFVMADYCAFFYSFMSTMYIIYSSNAGNYDKMERWVDKAMKAFLIAARCMVVALGLGLYIVLAPIGNSGAVVLGVSLLFALVFSNQFDLWPKFKGYKLGIHMIAYKLDGTTGLNPRYRLRRSAKLFGYFHGEVLSPILYPLFLIFLLALI